MNSIFRTGGHLKQFASLQWYPVGTECLPTGALQTVRWRRGRWTSQSKSKFLHVPTHKEYGLGEKTEISRLNFTYKPAETACRSFLKARYDEQSDTSEAARVIAEAEAVQHQEMMEYNRIENERMGRIRKQRREKALEDKLEYIMLSKMQKQQFEEEERERALHSLKETEEYTAGLIAPEDFASALERAYDLPIDPNFAMDSQGYVYPGAGTKPWEVKREGQAQLKLREPDTYKRPKLALLV